MVSLRRPAARWTLVLLAATTLALSGCSDDDSSNATTTTRPPTTTTSPPSTTAPSGAAGDPLPVAWVRQVGGPGDDQLRAVTGLNESVLGAGSTTGLDPATPPASGTTAALVDVVAATDGSPVATTQSTQDRTASADGIASGDGSPAAGGGDQTGSPTSLTCGTTASSTDEPDGPVVGGGGGTDAWCAPVAADGTIGTAQVAGSDMDDEVRGVAVHSVTTEGAGAADEATAFAVGRTVGLFPDAKDPSGGYLGDGDALVARLDPTGAALWSRQFGTTAADEANAVTTSDDGDAIVGGSTDGRTDGDVGGAIGARDGWMARIDPRGNLRWLTQFGSPGQDRVTAVASGGDPRRGTEVFVGAGSTDGAVGTSSSLGGSDAMVSAFDASGRQLWAVQLGSTADDEATGVVVDGSTIYVSGTAAGEILGAERISLTPTADPAAPPDATAPDTTTPDTTVPDTTVAPTGGGLDGFLAAFDADSGELRWVAQFGSTGDDRVAGMTRTESGLVVLAGSTTGQLGTTTPGGGTDGFMVAFVPPSGGGGAASLV